METQVKSSDSFGNCSDFEIRNVRMCLCICDGGPFNIFPKVNELGVGMCVVAMVALSLLLVGILVTGIVRVPNSFFLYFRTSSNVTVIAGVRSRKFKIETLRGIDM